MSNVYYSLGCLNALTKLGMQLNFDSPQQAQQHAKRRKMVGNVTGIVGGLAGGTAGSIAGSVAGGPAGGIAGGIAGGYLGEKALALPATTAYDATHDIRQRSRSTYNRTTQRLNAASGVPTGVGHPVKF